MALNSQELLEPWRAALARVLAEVTPGDLQNSFFINNGTDAIEGAIKLARLYTKRHTFISTLGGFHGKSMGSLSLMGKASFREPFQSGLQDVRFVPYGDAGGAGGRARAAATPSGTHIAGVVLEPVQGEAGGVVPPDDYLPRARAALHPVRRAAHRRRDPDRHGPHRQALGRGPLGRGARHHVPRQVDRRRRDAALGVHRQSRRSGR